MPGTTPLYNTKLQSSLDLNNNGLTGNNAAKRFIFKEIGATGKVIDVSDMGRLLRFSGSRIITLNNNIAGVTAGDTFTATTDSAINWNGTANIFNSFYDSYANSIIQFIYTGSNNWFVINSN